jgi:protein-disulfide isomerase
MCRLISTLFETIVPGTLRSRSSRSGDLLESLGQFNLSFEFTRLRRALLAFSCLVAIADCVAAQVPDEIVVAVVDGQKITQKQVDDSMKLKIYPLAQQLATVRKVALENLIIAKVLEKEALRRRISIDELRKALMTGEVNVTQQQVEDAYAQNSSFFAAMSPDEAKARLRLDLENQARMRRYKSALEELRQGAAIQLTLPSAEIATRLEDGRSPSLGPKNAALSIVEFSDFECPFCRTVQPTLKEILKSYGSDVRLIFKHLPSESHQHSMLASRAAACADEQDRFWQYHDILFASNDRSPENLRKIAVDLGLDIGKFQVCLTSEQSLTQVVRDLDLARSLRINSTPSFLINGRIISGALSLSEFRRIIEQALEKTGSPKRSSMN